MDLRNTTAFAAHAAPALRPRFSSLSCHCARPSSFTGGQVLRAATPARVRLTRMAAEPDQPADPAPPAPAPAPPADPVAEAGGDDATTSASEILKTLRAESAADDTPSERSMLGVYRDVDGKSNVWAVEPQEETDTRPQISKTTIIVAAAAFIVVALLVLPLLPFTNPDQL